MSSNFIYFSNIALRLIASSADILDVYIFPVMCWILNCARLGLIMSFGKNVISIVDWPSLIGTLLVTSRALFGEEALFGEDISSYEILFILEMADLPLDHKLVSDLELARRKVLISVPSRRLNSDLGALYSIATGKEPVEKCPWYSLGNKQDRYRVTKRYKITTARDAAVQYIVLSKFL